MRQGWGGLGQSSPSSLGPSCAAHPCPISSASHFVGIVWREGCLGQGPPRGQAANHVGTITTEPLVPFPCLSGAAHSGVPAGPLPQSSSVLLRHEPCSLSDEEDRLGSSWRLWALGDLKSSGEMRSEIPQVVRCDIQAPWASKTQTNPPTPHCVGLASHTARGPGQR